MAKKQKQEAQQTFNTASGNANSLYGNLVPEAQGLINSPGYDPTTLSAITNAGIGGVNSAFGSAGGQINRNAAIRKNPAGTAGQLDELAMNKGVAGGQEAGDIRIQNADFQNKQKMAGINLLSSLYGANQGQEVPAINAGTAANTNWTQGLNNVLSGVSGFVKPR